MKKIWIKTLFKNYKGLLLKKEGKWARVEFVGYPFGTYPNGLIKLVPLERIIHRKK